MNELNEKKVYYRIVRDFLGEETTFIPENLHEDVQALDDGSIIFREGISSFKEICFSRKIECCFLSLANFIIKGYYYIYVTTEVPCNDVIKCKDADFHIFEEVRYRKPVNAKCIGKLKISGFDAERLQGAYSYICGGGSHIESLARPYLDTYKAMKNFIEPI